MERSLVRTKATAVAEDAVAIVAEDAEIRIEETQVADIQDTIIRAAREVLAIRSNNP